jgi:hypothetical protein
VPTDRPDRFVRHHRSCHGDRPDHERDLSAAGHPRPVRQDRPGEGAGQRLLSGALGRRLRADPPGGQEIVDALRAYGEPGNALNWYSLKAVQAHESKHSTRVLQALENTMGRIRRDVAACRVPLNAAPNEPTAINQIQALPAFQTIFAHTSLGSGTPFGGWFDAMAALIANDHDTHGPCEDAEESVVRPLVNAINQRAVDERWVGTPGQIQGGTGAGTGIANVKNSLVAQPPTAPKQQLVLPPKKAWPPVGQ